MDKDNNSKEDDQDKKNDDHKLKHKAAEATEDHQWREHPGGG